MGFVVEVGEERTSSGELRESCFCRHCREFQLWFLVGISLPYCRSGKRPLLDRSKLYVFPIK